MGDFQCPAGHAFVPDPSGNCLNCIAPARSRRGLPRELVGLLVGIAVGIAVWLLFDWVAPMKESPPIWLGIVPGIVTALKVGFTHHFRNNFGERLNLDGAEIARALAQGAVPLPMPVRYLPDILFWPVVLLWPLLLLMASE